MQSTLVAAAGWLAEGGWLAAAIGAGASLVAFALGLRFLKARAAHGGAADVPLDVTFLGGVTRDRRCAPRRKGNEVEVELASGPDGPVVHGWVTDRSIGGLAVLTEEPFPQGAVLRVRPRKASSSTPWIDVTVRSCRAEAGRFELGCQFHRTPSWNLLLHFG
jgi:hypothetical protein